MQLWEAARRQNQRGHKLNAALLYAAAGQTADRGPNFQMGITKSIAEDMSRLDGPTEVQGQPPFLWKVGTRTWRVLNVSSIAVGGKIYVVISHEVASWQAESQVDGRNRELLAYFKSRFPECPEAFAGLVARATEQGGNRGYGTVHKFITKQ
jgi:hypothetical protein